MTARPLFHHLAAGEFFRKRDNIQRELVIRCGKPASWEFGDALPGLQLRKS